MRILLTGGTGFIGQHLQRELTAHGHHVYAAGRGDGDLTGEKATRYLFEMAQPAVVVHLAAQVGRVFGDDDPSVTIRSNALMTVNVAKAAAQQGARMAYVSTSEVYGDQGAHSCDEGGLLALPHNLYGLTKRWGEEASRLYAGEGGLQILRPSMPYGPGLPAGRGRAAIVNFLWQAATSQPIPVHTGSERSWCWVGDLAEGMRLVIESGEVWARGNDAVEGWGTYNVGRDDDARPMLEVARTAVLIAGGDEAQIVEVDAPANQTVVKRLSTSKLRSLGWQPQVDLATGMRFTYEAYREWPAPDLVNA